MKDSEEVSRKTWIKIWLTTTKKEREEKLKNQCITGKTQLNESIKNLLEKKRMDGWMDGWIDGR